MYATQLYIGEDVVPLYNDYNVKLTKLIIWAYSVDNWCFTII